MILADKLIALRKKAGWTQEELAEKMDVSRQSIAKWESAQSVPELTKIIRLSRLFEVSTDYLLKDEIEAVEPMDGGADTAEPPLYRVSMEEANSFLLSRKKAAAPLALAVLMCIISPVMLIFLSCLSDAPTRPISEGMATGLGMSALLVLVAAAVVIFISVRNKNAQYEYLEKELIDTEYGVDGMVKELRARFKPTYDRCNIIGVVICIFSILPIFLGAMADKGDPLLMGMMICLLFVLAAVGVYIFVRVGVVWASFEKLLQDGDYSREKKKEKYSVAGAVSGAYWLIVTAVFLAYSFATGDWNRSWIIWAVAGVLYPAVLALLRAAEHNSGGKK